MPIIRFSNAQWERAKTLFELGKSLSEIQNETGIDRSNINKRAKAKGWVKGFLPQIIDSNIKNIKEKIEFDAVYTTLTPQQQMTVVSESERILQGKDWYAKAARKVATKALSSLDGEYTARDVKDAMSALETGLKVEQIIPYYPTPTTAVKVDVNTEKNEISPQLKSAASIIES